MSPARSSADRPPSYTDQQLRTLEVLTRIRWAGRMLVVLTSIFVVFLGIVIYAAFSNLDVVVKVALALVEGVIGWSIKIIVTFLFPRPGAGDGGTDKPGVLS
jgi:hypothetical protein